MRKATIRRSLAGLVPLVLACLGGTPGGAVAARATRQPEIAEAPPAVVGASRAGTAKAAVDTIYILGGPDRGDGKFQDDLYPWVPDDEGWIPSVASPTRPAWHADTFNAAQLDPATVPNHAMWLGANYPPCGGEVANPGYENNLDESLEWSRSVADPGLPTAVRVTARLNHDMEEYYDRLTLEVMSAGGWAPVRSFDGSNRVGGAFIPVDVDAQFTVQPDAYQGAAGDEVRLRWRFVSDGGWSDADCLFDGEGAAQLDNVAVSFDQGGGAAPQSFDDFEGAGPAGWTAVSSACSFARIWPRLDDAGLCAQNNTPQLAFIDDGSLCPASDGTPGVTWTYGPGGFVAHCADPLVYPLSEFWSPPLALPGGAVAHDGCELAFDAYSHGSSILTTTIRWAIRTSDDSGQTWSVWKNEGFVYEQNDPAYRRFSFPLDGLIPAGADRVQISLGTLTLGAFSGNCAQFTPAPYFDNVALTVFPRTGPAISLQSAGSDAFPAGGGLDLADLGANAVPVVSWSGGPIAVRTVPRQGAVMTGPPLLHWRLRANPLFDPYRAAPPPNPLPGSASVADFLFVFPDSGFLYPGDILHYCFEASDDRGGEIGTTWLPADTAGLSLFDGDQGHLAGRFPREHELRALPTLRDAAGTQPPVLVWQNYAGVAADDEWASALANLGFTPGVDYDSYRTFHPALSRLGSATQIAGYATILYDGDRTNQAAPRAADLATIRTWTAAGGRRALFMGEDIAHDLVRAGDTGFMLDYLGLAATGNPFVPGNVRPEIDDQAAPRVVPVAGNAPGLTTVFVPNGCRDLNDFDGLQPWGTGEGLLSYTAPGGGDGGYLHFAGIYNHRPADDGRFVTLPYGLRLVESAPGDAGGPLAARTRLLGEILAHFGTSGSGPATAAPGGADGATDRLSARAYPNPFNPRVTVAYAMPRAGRLVVRILDARGRPVRNLLDRDVPAGTGEIAWDGRDDAGRAAAAGVYLCETGAFGTVTTRKLALVR